VDFPLIAKAENGMPGTLTLTPALKQEYRTLFDRCTVRPERQSLINAAAQKMVTHKDRYAALTARTGVPWTVIAVNHELECGQSFTRHLHNGDPLSAVTVNVPKKRPPGTPPWTWDDSAADALIEYARWKDWSLSGTLFMLERYNGVGYRLFHPSVLSPYLWSFSTHYTMGKYASDGVWSPGLVSKQTGAAVLLRRLAEIGQNGFSDQQPASTPLVVPYAMAMPTDAAVVSQATTLQTWLNTHGSIFVKPDGWAGKGTSDAYKAVTGHFLPGDPRTAH
jgi:lysozyme family protein